MALDIKRRSILNSLEDFLDHHAVKVMPHEKPSSFRNITPLEKFKEGFKQIGNPDNIDEEGNVIRSWKLKE